MGRYTRQMNEDLERKIKTYIAEREEAYLSEFASKSDEGRRRIQEDYDDIRAKYSRDCDRIMHTHAYSRYIDKTQVFFLVDNDHITHRVLHVQLVSKIARTIGRALKLNEDLIEAISLGHDIGHVPYGHLGECYLSELCKKNGIKGFYHNAQSVQFLDVLENRNLTLQVLDGILCHNGEVHNQKLTPNRDKDWEMFETEIEGVKEGKDFAPMTLEGCVVRFADRIAYLGRDVQDSIEIGLMKDASEVPEKCKTQIGVNNDEIINTLIIDLVENSYGEDFIAYSKDVSDAIDHYKEFNYKNIYKNPKLLNENGKIERMFKLLYNTFLYDLESENRKSKIYEYFVDISWIKNQDRLNNAEKVRDYIAGMTDRFFEMNFKEIVFPTRVSTYKDKEA